MKMSPCRPMAVDTHAKLLNLRQAEHRIQNAQWSFIFRILILEQNRAMIMEEILLCSLFLTKARKTATALQKDFQQERIFFFFFAFQIIEFLFSSAKDFQCSDPSKKSGSSSLELFMIYAYCHKGFGAWDSKNWCDQYAILCPLLSDQRCVLPLL